jgi:hypothetical protein
MLVASVVWAVASAANASCSAPMPWRPIDRVKGLSLEDFHDKYLSKNVPVIIEGYYGARCAYRRLQRAPSTPCP